MAVDWLRIKNDYINGLGSYRKLAEKYEVRFSALKDVAVREKWADAKKEHTNKVRTETEQKTVEKISDALSEEAAAKVRIRGKLIKLAEDWVDSQDRIKHPGDFRKIVQSCVDLGVMDVQSSEDIDDDGLMEALGNVAADLFEDGDDSVILPEEAT